MARDTQIPLTAPQAAPYDYTVPQNVELVLRQVRASFTDNGAAGDWLPAVVVFSDSGHEIGRYCDQGVKVTAGNDASVTWFPRLRGGGGGAAATAQWCNVAFGDVQPSGVITNPTGGTAMPILSFNTNSTAFTQVDANTISLPTNIPLVMSGYMQQFGGAPVTTNGDVTCVVSRSGGLTEGPFAANGQKVIDVFFGQVLGRTVEVGGNWTAWAAGSDTHFWSLSATFYGVF